MDWNELWVYGIFTGAFLLLFPIFLSVDGYADLSLKKVFFSVHLYKFIKIFGGYITFHKDGFAVHLSKKKAIFKRYGDLINDRNRFRLFDGFQFFTLTSSLELGDRSYPQTALYSAVISQWITGVLFPPIQKRKPYITLKNGVLLVHGENALKATAHFVTVFNQLTVLIAVSKILLEALIDLWQKKKNAKQLKT